MIVAKHITKIRLMRDYSITFLKKNNVPVWDGLPRIDLNNMQLSSIVAKRIVVLYALGALFEGVDDEQIIEWLQDEGISEAVLPEEHDFLSGRELTPEDLNILSWKQESLYALCWAGSLTPNLAFPLKECDLKDIFPLIPREVEVSKFIESFQLRSDSEIRQQQDIYYCLHHSIRHPEIWVQGSPSDLNPSVITERRHALEWLANVDHCWDDISLDT